MIIDVNGLQSWAIELAKAHWQDILPIVMGTFAALVLTTIVEKFVPTRWPAKTQEGIAQLANVLFSWGICIWVWGAFDGTDPLGVRAPISLVSSLMAVPVYPIVGKWASNKWPKLGINSIYAQP